MESRSSSVSSHSSQCYDQQRNIDEILSYLGNIGRYQVQLYILCILPMFVAGMLATSFVFTTAIPEHRCLISICESRQNSTISSSTIEQPHSKDELFNQSFVSFAIPESKTINEQYFNCYQYDMKSMNDTDLKCNENMFDNETIEQCDNLVFNHEYFQSTIVTEFNLFCKPKLVHSIQAIYFYGVLFGALLNGILADKYGRQLIIRIYSPSTIIVFLITIFASNAYVYAFCLFLKGMCSAALFETSFTLSLECLGGKWRFWLGNSSNAIFTLGSIYACLCAWWLQEWQSIEISNLIPTLFLLPYPFIMPESLRWEFTVGKPSHALYHIDLAARKNGVKIANKTIESFLVQSKRLSKKDKPKVSIKDLFTNRSIRLYTIIFLYIWFTNALGYYGFSFLSADLNDNIYISMSLLMIVEVPGVLLTSYIGGFSRKYILMLIMMLGGCFCIICSFMNAGNLKMLFAIFGKMSLAGSFSLVFVYSAEIFPTILRITGLSVCSFASRLGAMSAPHLVELQLFSSPFLIIGILALVASLLSMILPETKDRNLPDSLEHDP